jgi:hypothetical protein
MLYLLGCFIFFVISVLFMKWCRVENVFSKGIGLLLVFSLLANISLAENLSANLQPEKNDGYSISQGIATWILGDDGGVFSDFENAYRTSIKFTLFFLVLYVLVLGIEARIRSKRNE